MMRVRFAALGDVCTFTGGGTPSRKQADYFVGDIPWATVKDFKHFTIEDTEEHITEQAVRDSAASIVERGSVLLVTRVGLGKVAVAGTRLAINQDIKAVQPNADLDPEFLFWFLLSQGERLQAMGTGATVKGVTLNDVKAIRCPIPPVADQRRIVDLLSRAEGIVRLRREAQRKAAELIPAIFLDMFGDPATNPKRWLVEPFANVIGFTRYGPRFPNREYSDTLKGGRILRTTDIQNDGTIVADEAPMLPMTDDELQKYTLEPNTIVVTRTGATIGKVALYESSNEPAVAGAYLIEIRLTDRVEAPYILHLLLSTYGQQRLTSGSRAVAQPNINVPTIAAIPVPLPPLELQRQFAAKAEAVRSIIARQTVALATAQATLNVLLHRAFSAT